MKKSTVFCAGMVAGAVAGAVARKLWPPISRKEMRPENDIDMDIANMAVGLFDGCKCSIHPCENGRKTVDIYVPAGIDQSTMSKKIEILAVEM